MKRLLLAALIFLASCISLSAQTPTFVQVAPATATANSQTCSTTFPNPSAQKNTLFALVTGPSPSYVSTVTDSLQDGWVPIFSTPRIANAGGSTLYMSMASVTGSNTVTAKFSAVLTSCSIIAFEYSPTSVVFLGLPQTFGTGTTISRTSLGAGSGNTLLLFAVDDQPSFTFTQGAGFTLRNGTGGFLLQDAAVGAGTYSGSATISGSADWSSFFISLGSPSANTSTIGGTLVDLTGTPITSGTISFVLKPGLDTTISATARFTSTTVTCSISPNGFIENVNLSGPCLITQNTSLLPAGTYYQVSIASSAPGAPIFSQFNMYVIAPAINLSAVVPTPATVPIYNIVDTFSNQQIAGNKTFLGTVTLSGGSLLIINGPLNATNGGSFGGTFSGNPTFSGIPIFNQWIFGLGGVAQNGEQGNSGVVQDGGTLTPPTVGTLACYDANSNVTNTGCPSPFPAVVYSTAPGPTTGNIGSTTMVTPSATASYRVNFYADVTTVGTSCSANPSTVAINLVYQDPAAAAPQTLTDFETVTLANTGNGTLGVVFNFSIGGNAQLMAPPQTFRAKAGSPISFTTTASPAASCSPAIQYQLFPILEQMTAN